MHVDELDAIPVAGVVWHPIRRRLGIRAFGINAYSAEAAGKHVVEEHDESTSGAAGHEEVYFVVRGHATFTLDGEKIQAPAGTLVFVSDPTVRRVAVAESEDTLVLAIGADPVRPFEVSPWETTFAADPLLRSGRYDEALELMHEGLAQHPGNPSLLYNLACAEALSSRSADAIEHLSQAVTANEKYAELARKDPDFDGIRDEPGFPV